MDRKYITEAELKQAYEMADETKRLINGLIAYLRKNNQNTGNKISDEQADYETDSDDFVDFIDMQDDNQDNHHLTDNN